MAATARREGPPTRWKDNAVTSMGDMRRHNEIYPDLNNAPHVTRPSGSIGNPSSKRICPHVRRFEPY